MNAKPNFFRFYIITALFLLLSQPPVAMSITTGELADIIEAMESAIVDISLEYEWHIISPLTLEEKLEYIRGKGLLINVNTPRHKFSAARSLSPQDPNDPNFLQFDRFLLERSSTLMNAHGDTWDSVVKLSYNGKFGKHLQIGGWPREIRNGVISRSKPDIYMAAPTPIEYFSILHFRITDITDKKPLSAMLRRNKEFVRLDNTVKKVNGFNTIRAELLSKSDKWVYLRIYFSVDHGYTLVKYENMSGGPDESNRVAFVTEVHSIEQVAEGLWFPSAGVIGKPDSKRANAYIATSKIVVNQGLTDKHFDIEFPPGTKVRDEIRGVEYVVKPTEE